MGRAMDEGNTGSGTGEAPRLPPLNGARLTVRADASPAIGTGHVMRGLALALGWLRAGGTARLVSHRLPDGLRRRAEAGGIAVLPLPDPRETGCLDGSDLIAVDGWTFDEELLATMAANRAPLLVVDDTASRPRIPGAFVVNHNVYAETADYAGRTDATVLAGPRYALLRPEFSRPVPARTHPPVVRRLLLLLGGADPAGVSMTVLAAARQAQAAESGLAKVRLVVGAANPALARLQSEVGKAPGIEVLHDVQDMVSLMDDTDMVVSASGSTVLELASRGVPMLLGALVPEEIAPARRMDAQGAAQMLGPFADLDVDPLVASILGLARDPARRAAMSQIAGSLVDGHGVARVIAAVAPSVLALRP